jgi:hypothetical protein
MRILRRSMQVAVVCILALGSGRALAQPRPPPPTPVNVVNTPGVNVLGSVTVANPTTIPNPLPVTAPNALPVTVGNTASVNVANQPTVNIAGTASVAVTNTPTVLAQQSGSWTIASGPPAPPALGDHFQVAVYVTVGVNLGEGQVYLNFPRPGLVEQYSASCDGVTQKAVRVVASTSLASGFTTTPSDAGHGVLGGYAYLESNTVNFPQGWGGGFVLPTPVRLIVSDRVFLEVFRDRSNDAQSESCQIFLFGRWISP